MIRTTCTAALGLAVLLAAPAAAQHSQVSSIAVDPNDSDQVWVVNRDNDSVSVINVATESIVAEISVGVEPRTLAFNAAGDRLFVTNKRGNIPKNRNFVTPFLKDGTERRGTVSVINTATFAVVDTIEFAGTESYGVALAPNGNYIAVSGFRSGDIRLFSSSAPYGEITRFTFPWDLSNLPVGTTITQADSNDDFVADQITPRALVITSTSDRIFVAHNRSPFVSVLDVTLNAGVPTGITLNTKIDIDDYALDPIFDPTPVQVLQSQGIPRFLGDTALSPDGTRLLVPHLLFNLNHDVNHNFGPQLAGDFANRVYPALTMIDATNLSFGQGGDSSNRLHHELTDTLTPAENVPFGERGGVTSAGIATLGGSGSPLLGGTLDLLLEGLGVGDIPFLLLGGEAVLPIPPFGTLYCTADQIFAMPGNAFSRPIPNDPSLDGVEVCFQAVTYVAPTFSTVALSNPVRTVFGTEGFGQNKMGYRAGHPGRVLWGRSDRVLMLNRGSEDVFMYSVDGSDMELVTVFPPRNHFVERAALDTTTPMGDLPLGMVLVDDATTSNDDSILYVQNEGTRTVSRLRVDWAAGTITKDGDQIATVSSDAMSFSERLGQEIFEDASRAQTAGNFNNSCASCHFEGGDDANVWQRPAGPRSTMPVYGGTRGTGRMLWKSVRLNMGETGPMFGGENGGTGIFTDAEQQALIDYHEVVPFPLNPHLDETTQDYVGMAALGRDLFFGSDLTGMNGTGRMAGCAECHPDDEPDDNFGDTVRFYTLDFLPTLLTDTHDGVDNNDPMCTRLQENISDEGFRNVNSGVNVDFDEDTFPDMDRNGDGFVDIESYTPMNTDKHDDFTRDDPNSYPCLTDPMDPMSPPIVFGRDMRKFSIPTKLGVFATGPYFHDHAIPSLRNLLDPQSQLTHAQYGSATYPSLNKFFNEFHDIRGTDPLESKVQIDLQSTDVEEDIEAILAYIQSL